MVTDKVKSVLAYYGSGLTKFAEFVGKSQPNISNKAKRDSWNAYDLIKIAELTNTTLAFVDKDGKVVVDFSKEDIKEEK